MLNYNNVTFLNDRLMIYMRAMSHQVGNLKIEVQTSIS